MEPSTLSQFRTGLIFIHLKDNSDPEVTRPGNATGSLYPMTSPADSEAHSSVITPNSTTAAGSSGDDEEGRAKAREDRSNLNKSKHQRFVVFIGNLPYTATDESIQRHFAHLKPTSIRHRYERSNGRSKGFAFLEFGNYDHMKTCLKKSHQSAFDDGISPARSLNVELTAGGGGSKSKNRRTKLKAKNEKLRQERERRTLNEDISRNESIKSPQEKHVGKAIRAFKDNEDIHPSRKARMMPTE
ncbi:MAG: hypothetical protein Q9208_000699 [Pyrenodesmia sp. 3 TL-2023]